MKRLTDEERAARHEALHQPMSAAGAWAATGFIMLWILGGPTCLFIAASLDIGWLGVVGALWFGLAISTWAAALAQHENDLKAERRVFWAGVEQRRREYEERWGR